jgi:CheY-like chemotaxis protein
VHGLRILLAEDSLVNQKLAVALLEGQGHHVRVVSNGREAIAAVQAEEFDLVLMDVQMPEMDGLEATQRIRASEQQTTAHVPIVAMTAHALKGDRQRCLQSGMDDYVAKPVRADELFAAIDALFAAPAEAAPSPQRLPSPSGRGAGGEGGVQPRTAGSGHIDPVALHRGPLRASTECWSEEGDQFRPSPTASAAPPPEPDMPDWPEAWRAVRGDERLLRIIVEAASREIPRLMAALREAVAAGNAHELQLAAHTLKGAIRYFASGPGFKHVRCLEKMGLDKDLEGAQEGLAALEAEVRLLTPALAHYLQRNRPREDS